MPVGGGGGKGQQGKEQPKQELSESQKKTLTEYTTAITKLHAMLHDKAKLAKAKEALIKSIDPKSKERDIFVLSKGLSTIAANRKLDLSKVGKGNFRV